MHIKYIHSKLSDSPLSQGIWNFLCKHEVTKNCPKVFGKEAPVTVKDSEYSIYVLDLIE